MFYNVLRRLAIEAVSAPRYVNRTPYIQRVGTLSVSVRRFTDVKDGVQPPFDSSLLQVLVCPLSKKPLRYDAETNELINEELGIAYPIIDGIPNMIPQEARLIQKDADTSNTSQQE